MLPRLAMRKDESLPELENIFEIAPPRKYRLKSMFWVANPATTGLRLSSKLEIPMTTDRFSPSSQLIDGLNNVIRHRRSIKPSQFSDEPVSDEIVREMLENANWAPTHGHTEPWRFFVFKGPAKQRLGELLAELYAKVTPADSQKPGKAQKLMTNASRSSHLIVIAMQRQKSKKIPQIEEVEAVACAVQNLHLTATAHGVGGYWSSGKAICNDHLRDHLELGPEDQVLGLFYVGMPKDDWPTGSRRPIGEKVVWCEE